MNYATLQSTVLTWLRREDAELATEAPTWIGLGEDRMARDLRISPLLARTDLGIPAAQGYADLPARFVAIKAAQLKTGKVLAFIPSEKLDFTRRQTNGLSTPTAYTLLGGQIHVAPVWGVDGQLTVTFYRREEYLADAVGNTNWYLENAADVLLAASMLVAVVAMKADDATVGRWRDLYTAHVASLNEQFKRE